MKPLKRPGRAAPARGDQIREIVGNAVFVFEVMAPVQSAPPWRWADARIDGHRSAAEVGREVAFDRFKSQFTLYNLLFFDLVEGVGRAKSAPLADTRGGQAPAPGGYDPRAPMRPEAPRPAAGGMAPVFGAAPSPADLHADVADRLGGWRNVFGQWCFKWRI